MTAVQTIMKLQAISNQLARLSIFESLYHVENGLKIHCRPDDECVRSLCVHGLGLLEDVSNKRQCPSGKQY